ncbi:39S ribosomal protein L34, mitochondrial [Apus apus]|uniref:39S ribosomal protein L34, mitochondrial n=1 Tax=Apus apus TaxID=8895 RepID=UPI0021F8622B|nr:39S ribosomal protein L34, mitochondrial [Apus apus]
MAALGLRARVGGRFLLLQPPPSRPAPLRAASLLSPSLRLPLGIQLLSSPRGLLPGAGSPWHLPQLRTKARGNEYQPNNRKRKRTHGWIRRISSPAGVAVILRRMLKGRKSLTH